jgi:outer membrane protein TolC/DNA-binding MarR family transcriptional regulator
MKALYNFSERMRYLFLQIFPRLDKQLFVYGGSIFKEQLTLSQIKILLLFNDCNKYKMSEVAKLLYMPLPTVTHVVDQLVKSGYLKRSFEEKDRRIVYIEITKKGKSVLEESKKHMHNKLRVLFEAMNKVERDKFLKIMKDFITILENVGQRVENKINKMLVIPLFVFLTLSVSASENLTLDESIKYALEHNPKILIAKEKIRAAEGNLTSAAALLYPSLSAIGTYTRSSYLSKLTYGDYMKIPVLDSKGMPTGSYVPFQSFSFSSDREGDVYIGKISLQYTLFSWGRLQANYEIALTNKLINEEEYKKTVIDVTFDVKKDFYTILLVKEMLNVLQKTKMSLESHIKVIEERYNAGLASKFEVLRTKVQLTNLEPQITKANNQLEMSIISFNTNLGSETNDKFIPVGKLEYQKEDFELQKSIEDAIKNRNEIKQMDLRKKIAEESITLAVSGYRPSVLLTANYQANRGQQLPPNDTIWQSGWDIGVVLNIPIFDGFNASGRYQEAESNLNQVILSKKQLLDLISLEVKSSYLTLISAEKTILAQSENINVAKESLNMVKKRYEEGLATNLEVLDTEVSVLQAELNYLQALYDYNISKERLKKAIGGENAK